MKIIIWYHVQGPNLLGPKSFEAQMRSGTISALALKALNCLQYHSFYYYLLVLELTVALVMHCCFLLARSVVELVVVVTAFVIAESFSVLARSLLL